MIPSFFDRYFVTLPAKNRIHKFALYLLVLYFKPVPFLTIQLFKMKNFKIEHRAKSGIEVLDLHGELDAHTASQLEDSLKHLIDKGNSNIIVNCRELEYIASAGLGVFMAYIEDVRESGGDIKLTNMNDKVYNVFDLLGFPTLYDILDEEEQAVKKFKND